MKIMGEILISRPLSFWWYAIFFLSLALSIICLLVFGVYSERVTVMGELEPENGIVSICPSSSGSVKSIRVKEGAVIKKDEILATITNKKIGFNKKDLFLEQSKNDAEIMRSYIFEKKRLDGLVKADEDQRASNIMLLEEEVNSTGKQIEDQKKIIEIAVENYEKNKYLFEQGFISKLAAQQKLQDVIRERSVLEQHLIASKRARNELSTQRRDVSIAAAKYASQYAVLDRSMAELGNSNLSNQFVREFNIIAPQDGIITGVTVHEGQDIGNNNCIMKVIPSNSKLVASLHAPSRSIGMVKVNDRVAIRYDAFPYQKFGQKEGRIISISSSSESDIRVKFNINADGENKTGYYKLKVAIEDQSIQLNNSKIDLRPGMILEADLLQEKKPLYRWLLLPLEGVLNKSQFSYDW